MHPVVGEVYLCSQDSDGEPILLKNFKGVKINNFCGGYYRAFVLEQDSEGQGKIHSLHPPEFDEYDYTFTEKNPEELAHTQQELKEDLQQRYRAMPPLHNKPQGHSNLQDYNVEIEVDLMGAQDQKVSKKELSAVKEVEGDHPPIPETHRDTEDYYPQTISQNQYLSQDNYEDGIPNRHTVEDELGRPDFLQTDAAAKIYSAFDGKGTIKEIRSGKNHILLLNTEGQLFSYGYGEYGVMGRGMAVYSPSPQPITNLHKQFIIKVACGLQHCLALSNQGEVYAWGRGFEGQLGLSLFPDNFRQIAQEDQVQEELNGEEEQNEEEDPYHLSYTRKKRPESKPPAQKRTAVKQECCSFPRVIRFFHKLRKDQSIKTDYRENPIFKNEKDYPELTIGDIECGAYHSLAITKRGKLYGWGDSGCGQLGIGRNPKVWIPTHIQIKEIVMQVAAGYAHTACITSEGFVYTFGLNHKYQLGFDDQKSRYKPDRVILDDNGLQLAKIIKIGSGDYNCFALSDAGEVYAWGSGVLGIKEMTHLTRPKVIKGAVADRKITDMYVNSGNAIFFTPVKITSMKPNCGPSSGGTIFSIIGVGLCDMGGKQKIRFSYGQNDQFKYEANLKYDESTNSYYSQTPNFEADAVFDASIWPAKAKVAVTLDGYSWVESDTPFFIYSSRVRISNINPKFASVEGGLEMCIELITDQKTMKEFNTVSVGFQATVEDIRTDAQKVKAKEEEKSGKREDAKSLNPVDLPLTSTELEKADWIYFEGTVREKDVIISVPPLYKLKSNSLYFNIDVSLNGQQFLGSPAFFRYYKVSVEKMSPDNTIRSGGTMIVVTGSGFIDSSQKKIRLSNSRAERLIDVKWEKSGEYYYFYTPPINWLSGKEDELSETEIEEISKEPVKAFLTISGKDWIQIGSYTYYEPKLKQLLPGPVPDKTLTEDAIKEQWVKEEPITNPLEGLSEKDADKKRIELDKKLKEEQGEIEFVFRKPGSLLYIEGENFQKKEKIIARCYYKQMQWDVPVVYKNSRKVGFVVPLMEGPPEGVHDMTVHLSFNGGEQFGHHGLRFKYFCFNKETPDVERNKLMDAELKNAKKGGKK